MKTCEDEIKERLLAIESEEGARILYACESGSRAWGFPSKDSDCDVRFIYIRPRDWYLSIFDKRDVIERPNGGRFDMSGWDLKKALLLLNKSNPALMEWLRSPIVYLERYSAAERIRGLFPRAYSPKSYMHHYLRMAKGNYRDFIREERGRIKTYLNALRPVLACEWIGTFGTLPPVSFRELAERLLEDGSELKSLARELQDRKTAGGDPDIGPEFAPMNAFLEERIRHYERLAPALPAARAPANEELDRLFRSALAEVWEG